MSRQTSFNTILIRRKHNERPTEWELRLRPMAQKIRIVEKLNGDPHLMVAGAPSVAIRMYTIHDVQRLEKELPDDNDHDGSGVDGLKHFSASYEHAIVFFVLPSNHQRDQLSRRDSFLHLAQSTKVRILVVSDVSQAISAISSIVQSLAPEKREKKRKYYAQIAEEQYLPSSMVKGGVEPTQETIANFAKTTMSTWADRMEMQRGDINVALDMLGSLAAVATATRSDLDNIPITAASKDTIRHFFGGIAHDEEEEGADGDNEEESEMFGDIDDSELMNIPDPSPAQDNVDQMVYNPSESYEYDGHEFGHSYQSRPRDFYTPINPTFAHRRSLDQGYYHQQQQGDHGHGYDYPLNGNGMNFNTGPYHPSANDYHEREYDDFYSRSVRQYTNQFM